MKLGQMASYLDEGLPEPLRDALAELQSQRPADERRPRRRRDRARARRAARARCSSSGTRSRSPRRRIGQVHRAVVVDPRPASSAPSPSRCSTPASARRSSADLRNADLLGTILRQGFGGLDPDEMVAEIKARARSRSSTTALEAREPAGFADYYRGHPFIHVPDVLAGVSTRAGADDRAGQPARRGTSCSTWDQQPSATSPASASSASCSAASTACTPSTATRIPATTCSTATGRSRSSTSGSSSTSPTTEMATFVAMVTRRGVRPRRRRRSGAILEDAGMLRRGAPVDDGRGRRVLQPLLRERARRPDVTWTQRVRQPRSCATRSTAPARSPSTPRCPGRSCSSSGSTSGSTPCSASCGATGNYRRIAEELWPFTARRAVDRARRAEAEWLAGRAP